jgi:hypothetical protein
MLSEGKAPKNGEPIVGFSFLAMLQNTRRFGQGFLSKETCNNFENFPILAWPWLGIFLNSFLD